MLHQLTGQKEGISAADFRVFRQYKRNHAVFIILDDAADYCEPPQQLKDSTAEQDPGRSGDTAQFIQKKDLGDGSLSVAVCFQKITSFTHKEHIADKKMIQKGDNDSQNQEKSGNVQLSVRKLLTARSREKKADVLVDPRSTRMSARKEAGEAIKSEINVPWKRRRTISVITSEFVSSEAKGALTRRSMDGIRA